MVHGQASPGLSAFTFGGSADDAPTAVAVDPQGNVFITGTTASGDLPGTSQAFQKSLHGLRDGFVAKFDASGRLLWTSYLGGNDSTTVGRTVPTYDNPLAIAVDPQGNVYVAGETGSTNFPIVNPFQPSKQRANAPDGFLTKIDPTGSRLIYSTYLGSVDSAASVKALTVGVAGDAFVAMEMQGNGFANINQLDPAANIVVGRFNPAGSPVWFTRAGAPRSAISGIALDDSGQVAVAAYASPTTYLFKLDTSGARQVFGRSVASALSSTIVGDLAKTLDRMLVSGSSATSGNGFVSAIGDRAEADFRAEVPGAADHRLHVASDLLGNLHLAFDTTGMDWVPPGLARPQHPDGPLFASLNSGQTFSWSSDGLAGSVLSMGIDPGRGYLYASTLCGIYRSLDHGSTWQPWDLGDSSLWSCNSFALQRPLAVDPADSSTVYAAVGHVLRIDVDSRRATIVRPVDQSDPASFVTSLAVSPHDGSVWVTDSRNVYVSVDRGTTWTNRGAGFPMPNGVALDPVQRGVVYVYGNGGVRRSADAGAQWRDLPLPRGQLNPGSLLRVQTFAVDPVVPNRLYAGLDTGLKISEDAGRTWVAPALAGVPMSIAASASAPSRLFMTTDAPPAILVSQDRGVTWTAVEQRRLRTALTSIAIDPADPRRVYASNSLMNVATFVLRLRPAGATYVPSYASYSGDGELRDLGASIDGDTIEVLHSGGNVRVIRIGRQ